MHKNHFQKRAAIIFSIQIIDVIACFIVGLILMEYILGAIMTCIRCSIYIFCIGFNLFLSAADAGDVMLEFDPQEAVQHFSWIKHAQHRLFLVNRAIFKPIKTPAGIKDSDNGESDELSRSERGYRARMMQGMSQASDEGKKPLISIPKDVIRGRRRK